MRLASLIRRVIPRERHTPPDGGLRRDSHVVARPATVLLLATLIIATTVLAGMSRGMHQKVSYGPESEQAAISIALSEMIYRLRLGYVGFASVNTKLKEIWNRGAKGPHDPILIENSSNGELMNEAIRVAASLGPQPIRYIGDRSLITMFYDDLGQVDFNKLGFRLFGLNIESRYYLFFTLLALSALIFVLTFHDNIHALVVLLCALFAFYVELHLAIFSPYVPTYAGMRHGSTLGLIPMWYFVFLTGRRMSPTALSGAVAQLAILLLAWRIRGSTAWMFVFIWAVAIAKAALRLPRRSSDARWLLRLGREAVRGAAQWPLIMLLVGIAVQAVYLRVAPHPAYARDDFLPYHGLWHSAYLGLKFSPELMSPRVQAAFQKYGASDTLGHYAALDYADRIRLMPWKDMDSPLPAGFLSPWTNEFKPRMHDDLMRGAVLEALTRRPLETFRLYLYKKPVAICQTLYGALFDVPSLRWPWLVLAGGVGVLLLMLIFDKPPAAPAGTVRPSLLALSATIVAALPNLWAYPGPHASIDMVLTFVAFMPLALGLGAMAAMWRMLSSLHAVAQ